MELTFKFKNRLSYRTPVRRSDEEERALWESVIVLGTHRFTPETWLQMGVEYIAFFNLRDRAEVAASTSQDDDFHGLVVAGELTNFVDYLGYRVASKIGFRQGTRYFRDGTRTGNVVFVQIFAGLGS